MNDIERFLDQACCGVGGSPDLRRHLRGELREHLTEEIERKIEGGMTREEATRQAIEEFGDPVMIREGLQTVHGRRVTALLIEKSMAWREKTMKNGWKWSFIAHVALVLTIAAEVYLAIAVMTYLFPSMRAIHEHLGTPIFGYLDVVGGLWAAFLFDYLWVPCLMVALLGVAFFEWKYRGQNKSMVRLAGLSLVSSVAFMGMAAICVPLTIDLAILPGQIYDLQVNLSPQQAERMLLPQIAKAHTAFTELGGAIERKDWSAVGASAERLSDTCRSLRDVGNATLVLAGEDRQNNLNDIRYLIHEIRDSSRLIRNRFSAHERSKPEAAGNASLADYAQSRFERLDTLYAELGTKSDLFAAQGNAGAPQ